MGGGRLTEGETHRRNAPRSPLPERVMRQKLSDPAEDQGNDTGKEGPTTTLDTMSHGWPRPSAGISTAPASRRNAK